MRNIKVRNMQTLYDIALQETGTIASVFAIAAANSISVTEVLLEGQTIQIPDTIINTNVLKDYLIEGVNPATAFAVSVPVRTSVVEAVTTEAVTVAQPVPEM